MNDSGRLFPLYFGWQLCTGMSTEEVKATIETAVDFTGFRDPRILNRPRLLSDNGPCYVSQALKDYLEHEGIAHTRGRSYHPMTQGKVARWSRFFKNTKAGFSSPSLNLFLHFLLPMQHRSQP